MAVPRRLAHLSTWAVPLVRALPLLAMRCLRLTEFGWFIDRDAQLVQLDDAT